MRSEKKPFRKKGIVFSLIKTWLRLDKKDLAEISEPLATLSEGQKRSALPFLMINAHKDLKVSSGRSLAGACLKGANLEGVDLKDLQI